MSKPIPILHLSFFTFSIFQLHIINTTTLLRIQLIIYSILTI